jgi:molybdopterin molybdotransferase
MIDFEEAQALIAQAALPLGRERITLDLAQNRLLAAPVIARIDSPRQDNSAMDGYALREAELADVPARLKIVGQSFAGQGFEGRVEPGWCVRIFTGAPVPEGTDRVVIQEQVRREGDYAIFEQPGGPARHIRKRGGDFHAGEILLQPGRRLDPRALVVAAGADCDSVEVWQRPRVIVVSTGDELAEPGTARSHPGKIPESIAPGIAAMAQAWGAEYRGKRRLADDLEAMRQAAPGLLEEADLVIVTGGASVGERDFAKAMFEPLGLELLFSKVSVKPGKPVWLGRAGGGLVLGLPGNPTSALVTARLFLAPLLAGMTGGDPASALQWRKARLTAPLPANGDREGFVRAAETPGGAKPLENQDSGAQKTLGDADLLIRRAAEAPAAEAGDEVGVIAF